MRGECDVSRAAPPEDRSGAVVDLFCAAQLPCPRGAQL
jgi:hypothetical protein